MRHKPIVAVLLLMTALVGCSSDPEKLKMEYLASGDKFVAEKKYSEAIIEYRNAIAQDARFGEARFKLAKAAEANGDALTAFREYVRAADLLPNDPAVQLRAGQVLLVARRYPEARDRADTVLQKDPKNVQALILMGNALANLKDFSGAISELEEAIEADSQRTLTYANLGVVQMAKGDMRAAESAFKRSADLQPKSTEAHLSLANFYWSAGRLVEAETEFKQALTLEPKSPVVLRSLSAFYMLNNRIAESEPTLKAYAEASKDIGPRLMLADYYVNNGKTPDATAILDALAKDDKSFAAATIRLAAISYAATQRQHAYELIDGVIQREPKNEQGLLLKSRFLIADNKPADALALANKVLEYDARSLQAQYYKALALDATGSKSEAVDVLSDLLKQVPSSVPVQIKLAALRLDRGDSKGAAELASQAVKARPASGVAHLILAEASLGQGNLTQAESELKIVASANPNSAQIHTLFGRLYSRKGDIRNARTSFGRALELQPDFIEALAGLIRADLGEKNPAAARARILAGLSKKPDDPTLLTLAGATFRAIGDAPQAEAAYQKALEKDPANFDAYRSLGNLYFDQRRLDDAKSRFEEAARKHPEAAVGARTMVATILEMQNKHEEARKEYEKVLEIDPQAAVAANNLAWAYADSGANLDVALQLAQTAKAKLPNNADVSDTLGWIYYKKGLASLAITAFKDGVTQDRSNPLIHYHLGLAYAKNGNRPEAQRSLEQALKLDPRFAGADEAKRVLGTLKG
jgi:tetratricopeptide (TPR) repeat protein